MSLVLGISIDHLDRFKKNRIRILALILKPRTFLSVLVALSNSNLLDNFVNKLALFWPSLQNEITKLKPDVLLIFTGGAFTGVENAALFIASKTEIRSVLIVDNWDNLSSKSTFTTSPVALGVWGADMLEDAREIHGMQTKIVEYVGSARFRPNERVIKQLKGSYILFAGSGKPLIDEPAAVVAIAQILDNLSMTNTRIIYRPHPMSNIVIDEVRKLFQNIANVEIDKSFSNDLRDNFYKSKPLEYLEDLCVSAKLVVAPLSSIIVESLSVGTPVLSLNWRTDGGRIAPLEEYSHLLKIRDRRGFFPVNSKEELDVVLPIALTFKSSENLVSDILPTFSNTYSSRVLDLIERVLLMKEKT
jgi:hypothetical protein